MLIISALSGIIAAIQAIFQELKERFAANPNRIMYITMVHDGLRPGVKIGPFQFSKDTVEEIVQRCHEKIDSVLESHASLDVNRSLEFFIRVLGKPFFTNRYIIFSVFN